MTSTSTPQNLARRRHRQPANGPEHEETVHQTASTPIFTALARQWAAERRAVPGDVDDEWSSLVDYATWRRRQRLPHSGLSP
ncbi:hypothetical protein [Streptomyces alkaliterrae]|uniref:Uncharacterized protein n=1 Tax=Streptomyces alkaliterrae TaxID=2213162 RepID=A0A5P0YSD6_9ACTN|nr:hypothetical protein [Streptomyces alkaliterrae]MBB1254770.1 hypothetical protein [Streptomyces alkaliterrae]MBB1261163.1 hypothetical protein [Streptomyces alkaliterrae]MQS03243.1 hypothetical protein [Streptomyces alkaliterrae]